jgi:hypothetical protein
VTKLAGFTILAALRVEKGTRLATFLSVCPVAIILQFVLQRVASRGGSLAAGHFLNRLKP